MGVAVSSRTSGAVEVPLDQRPDDLVAEPLGGGIDRQHLAPDQRVFLPVGVGQDDELSGSELPPVVEPNRSRHQQRLPHRDAAVEKRLTRPDALEYSAVIPQHRVKDPQPAPGGQHSFRHHPPDTGNLLPYLGADQRGDGRRIYVAVGKMPEQIAGAEDSQPAQLVGPPLTYALEELDGGIEPEGSGLSSYGFGGLGGLQSGFLLELVRLFTTEAQRTRRRTLWVCC